MDINGGGSQDVELPLGGSIDARGFLYVVSVANDFAAFFGFASDITSGALNFNDDDGVELYYRGVVSDACGDRSGTSWEYTDGWSCRVDLAVAEPVFAAVVWTRGKPPPPTLRRSLRCP